MFISADARTPRVPAFAIVVGHLRHVLLCVHKSRKIFTDKLRCYSTIHTHKLCPVRVCVFWSCCTNGYDINNNNNVHVETRDPRQLTHKNNEEEEGVEVEEEDRRRRQKRSDGK